MEKHPLPETLLSSRIVLKRHSLDLAERMFRSVDGDRERLRVFLPWVDLTRTLQDEVDYIRMTREQWDACALFDYGIFLKEGQLAGEYLGNVGVHSIAWQHRRCELGYWILGEYEGKGYILEAVRTLERALFAAGFNRIEIHCSSANARSANIPRSNGYTLEGTLRQDAIEHGKFRDTLIFGKLASDLP